MSYAANISVCIECRHRQRPCAGPCPCKINKKDVRTNAKGHDCPMGLFPPPETVGAVRTIRIGRPKWDGAAAWAELHRRARAFTGNVNAEHVWLQIFAIHLPCGDCKQHWKELVKANPPDLLSPEAYFAWTVKVHNQVNLKLDKPEMSLVDAQILWKMK